MQRFSIIIYHSAALCRDWTSLYIILSLYAETGLHNISFFRSMQTLGFIIYHSVALCRDWASLCIILSLNDRLDFVIYYSAPIC